MPKKKEEPRLVAIWVTPATRLAIKQRALTNNQTMINQLAEDYQ